MAKKKIEKKAVKIVPYNTDLFTGKELDVIRMICDQASNEQIATAMGLGTRTIEGYRAKILRKMKVLNTAGLVVYAIKKGIYKI